MTTPDQPDDQIPEPELGDEALVEERVVDEALVEERVVDEALVEEGAVVRRGAAAGGLQRYSGIVIGILTLIGFTIAALLLSQCGADDERVASTTPSTSPTTGVPATTAAPTTTATPTTTEAPVDLEAQEMEAVRAALDAEGYENVGLERAPDGSIRLTGEVESGIAQSKAGRVADAAAFPETGIRNLTTVPPLELATAVIERSSAFGEPEQILLTGEVRSEDERDAMGAAAADEVGADNVTNELTVVGDRDETVVIARGSFDSRGGQRRLVGISDAIAGSIGADLVDETSRSVSGDLADLEAELNALVEVDPVLFASGSNDLSPEAIEILDRAVVIFEDIDAAVIEIGGHTDDQGGSDANQALSERRAASVANYLSSNGVDPARLAQAGYGEAIPVASNLTDEGRALNRRIEFRAVESSS